MLENQVMKFRSRLRSSEKVNTKASFDFGPDPRLSVWKDTTQTFIELKTERSILDIDLNILHHENPAITPKNMNKLVLIFITC